MAAPNKFSFGQPSTTSQPSGSTTNNAAPSGGSGLFGSTPAPSTGGSGIFGSTTPASNSAGSGLFGGAAAPSASGSGLFGAPTEKPNPAPAASSQTAGATTASPAPAFSWATPSKPSETSKDQSQTPKPLFGGLGSSSSNPATTTPTNKPTSSLFANSTTPAGPPPTTSIGAGSSTPQTQKQPSLFDRITKPSTDAADASTTSISTAPNPFDATKNADSNGSGGQQEINIFGAAKKSQDTPSNSKASPFALGGQSQPAPTQTNAPPPGGTSDKPAFNFLKPPAPGKTSTEPTSSAETANSSTPANPIPTSNLFSPSKPQDDTSSTPGPSTSIATTADSATPSLGQTSGLASASPLGSSQPSTHPPSKPTTSDAPQSTNLSASTAGPLPPVQSRLKNKSMDEIINKWATDLSKYQKEFQTQAEKIARWDRMLVENSEKIQKLYGQTLEAERATTEVERQLSAVENDQLELESWLNHYEGEVDRLIKQQGEGETTTGPDAERQRTYQLAGRLSERLDEMNKDLSSMINEINDAASNLSRTGKKDDPLSQVVRVLNGHLTQLQQIDQGASALNQKVNEAQKASRAISINGGTRSGIGRPNSEAADGFWRSYMGRR